VFLDFFVDLWWFRALDFEAYFWLRGMYRYALFGVTVIVFFLFFFLNFWIASRFLGAKKNAETGKGSSRTKPYRELVTLFRTASLKVYVPLSLVLSVPIAWPLFQQWERTLLYLFAPAAGASDPFYQKDVCFYLFSYPIYSLLQGRFLLIAMVLLVAVFILYWLEGRVLTRSEGKLPRGAKVHLSALILFVVGIQAWGYMLQRYGLLFTDSHQPLFYGPGYTEMRVILPLIWLTLVALISAALSLIIYIHTRRGLVIFVVLAACFGLAHALPQTTFLPEMVQKYIVKPNESTRQRPFIAKSIASTLAAFDLTEVKKRDYDVERLPWITTAPVFRENLRNIPVWDKELLGDVYEQLQGIRPYYQFRGITVDRYTVQGLYQQVYLAARELNLEKLPEYAKSWINRHLQYTHGYGVVMTPAAQGGDEIMTWFIQDIPPRSDYGLEVERPEIYYGMGGADYVVVPNLAGEMDYPKGETNITTKYQGRGGVALSSLLKKLLFSVYFKDRNLFFTGKVDEESRIQFRRSIVERIKNITPFFKLDQDPYVVITAKGTFWIQDGYTVADRYPVAAPYDGRFNYIRNSVKIVVDAYHGTVDYYVADSSDPIVQAYKRMYPGLLKDLKEMEGELKPHLRYPRDLFKIQMAMYAKYHQTDPEVFYRDEDLWEFPEIYRREDTVSMEPYYVTLDLMERGRQEFLLLCPMGPRGRDNLRALCVVGCDEEHYGQMTVYSFPKGRQVYGPSQINALIDQDTTIAELFTLWNQVGSEVMRGKMIILPIGRVVFYIQPVYLRAAARLKIPELKRLIVSQGDTVVIDSSLEAAFARLEKEIKEQMERQEHRFEKPEVKETQAKEQPSEETQGQLPSPSEDIDRSTPKPDQQRTKDVNEESPGPQPPPVDAG
jgi:hypothetical protein